MNKADHVKIHGIKLGVSLNHHLSITTRSSLVHMMVWCANYIILETFFQIFYIRIIKSSVKEAFGPCWPQCRLAMLAWSNNESIFGQQPLQPRSLDFNTLSLRWNRRHFADNIFKCIFLNENIWTTTKISLKFIPKGPINNIPALVVQIMAWCWPDVKPLSEPMMVRSLMHICITRPQWVNPDKSDDRFHFLHHDA